MKIDLRKYEFNKHYLLEEDVDFSSHQFDKNYRIRKITSCHIKIDLVSFEDIVDMRLEASGDIIGACSYTEEDVPLSYHFKEEMTFSHDESRGADYFESGDIIDMDPYIFALIDSHIPLNIHKKGAKMPQGGEGYEVLSEEDYYKKKKEEKGPSPFDVLDDIELDDDDE